MPRKDLWTREQTIVAFDLYCRIPFGHAHSRNKEVQKVAKLIGRSPGAVARKLGNFGSLDPELRRRNVVGLENRSKLDEVIWDEFQEDREGLIFEAAKLVASFSHQSIEQVIDIDLKNLPKGQDKLRLVKTRLYQNFFRDAVFAAYDSTCCVTGLRIPELQVASHIIPWSIDEGNRTNPENGLCLNALHDRAFDKGLITVLPNFKIAVSSQLKQYKEEFVDSYFRKYHNQEIIKPHKFIPDKQFLEYHNDTIFKK